MPKRSSAKKTVSKKSVSKKSSTSKAKPAKKSPINHFEIPFDNLERTKKFYGSIFGWDFIDMPEMDYTMVFTTEVDQNQAATTPGAVNGGLTKKNPLQTTPTLVVTVESVDAISKQIEASGGQLLGEKIPVGDMGLYQLFKDPEGNVLGIFQSIQRM
ncbi:MAG: VOC family protein [Candidatus Thorarchaeota archaeon]